MSKSTERLLRIVQRRAGEANSWSEAQQLLQAGADLKATTKNGSSMIESAIAEEKRLRQSFLAWNAENCRGLIEVLRRSASEQLAAQIFSAEQSDLTEMAQLVNLHASCYQKETYGPLGLLGSLLSQSSRAIPLSVVQFLVENDRERSYSWNTVDEQEQTCVSIAKRNPNCPPDVIDYVQAQFDLILNRSALMKEPPIDPNEMIKWVRRGANIEVTDRHGNTVLCNAVVANHLALVDVLISLGSNTAHQNGAGCTPLQIALNAPTKNPQLTGMLEKQTVNVQLKNLIESKRSRLTVEDVLHLLDRGANINATYANNDSLLHILIAHHGTPQMIAAFIKDFNADLSKTNMDGLRAVERCLMLDKHPFDRLRTFLQLTRTSTDLFINPQSNKTLLQFAHEQQRSEAAKLIENELNDRLWNAMTAMNSNESNQKAILHQIQPLLACGAQINYQHRENTFQGWTILHLACQTTATTLVVHYLIDTCKADYLLANAHGDYSLSIAAEYGRLAVVEYLSHLPNSQLNVWNKDRQTPLHLATRNHHFLVVKYLVKWGADHQAQNLSKETPADVASSSSAANKEEAMTEKKLIQFFRQLICPPVTEETSRRKKVDNQLDTCELAAPVQVNPIQILLDDVEEKLGGGKNGFFARSHNENLRKAAKDGDVFTAQQALAKGADVRSRQGERSPHEMAQLAIQKCLAKLYNPTLDMAKRTQVQNQCTACQQIVMMTEQIAREKLLEAIKQSNAGLVAAYHLAGAPLTADLLPLACQSSDNVEIVDYLLNQNMDIYQALIHNPFPMSLYRQAKMRQFTRLSAYLKYRLSIECGKAIIANDLALVKKLVQNGASVDMDSSNHIEDALKSANAPMIDFLCQHGARLPMDWLTAKTIVLPSATAEQFQPEIRFQIDRCLLNRRLRFAAAIGDFKCLIQCQRLGADINAVNCHGSTALLCAIEHGNYFPIVHALVSSGASMLHSNEDEPLSLIDLAKKHHYTQTAHYLFEQLNVQFLTAVLNHEREDAEKLSKLGANFNWQDEQKRTPLHYAVEYHGVELVQWLCERGSNPTSTEPDINGDYPITLATEKGDYSMVEFFVIKYAATRNQVNRDGLTPLQIAEKFKFKRIAQLISTGKPVLESQTEEIEPPKLTPETLRKAAADGPIKTIEEFIAQQYESVEEKRRLCYELLQIAKKHKQLEIVDILEPYYKKSLRTQFSQGIEDGDYVKLQRHFKEVLLGFLSGLSHVIANSDVVLDPTDPNTYVHLFSDLTSNVGKRSRQLEQVSSEQEVKKLFEQDLNETKQQLAKIQQTLEQTSHEKHSLQTRIEEIDQRVFKDKALTASQRKQYLLDKESFKQKLAGIEASMLLYERQQRATQIRQNTMKFIKGNANLALFYGTIENRLQALFISVLAVQGGYVKRETTSASLRSTTIPFMGVLISNLKATLSPILSKLNEKEQKQEWQNISTFGNVEELNRIASDTAGMLTLYYKEQIQSIDTSGKIKGSNLFNEKVRWMKDFLCDVRPESAEEFPVVIVAEYLTSWIIDLLKLGKKSIDSKLSLPSNFWLHVAKQNPVEQEKVKRVAATMGLSPDQQRIPLRIGTSSPSKHSVPLSYLIGCVTVLTDDGEIYASPLCSEEKRDIFGYVYLKPFSSDGNVRQKIIEGRQLKSVEANAYASIRAQFDDIIAPAETYAMANEEYAQNNLLPAQETANQVAQLLEHQKCFVTPDDLGEQLKKEKQNMDLSIDTLREEIEERQRFYQISIEDAREQVQREAIINRETMKKENQEQYERVWNQLHEKFNQIEAELKEQTNQRLAQIEQQFKEKTKEIRSIAQAAQLQATQAIEEATQARQNSLKALQEANHAAMHAQDLVQSTEERRREFQLTASNCETTVQQTVASLKQSYEKIIADIRAKVESDLHHAKDKAREAAQDAKEAASNAREVQRTTKEQLELQKRETDRTLAGIRETRSQCEKAVAEAHDAENQAKRAANTSATALHKVETALQQFDKLSKKF